MFRVKASSTSKEWRQMICLWAGMALVLAVAVGLLVVNSEVSPEGQSQNAIAPVAIRPATIDRLDEHLAWAHDESLSRLPGHFAAVDRMFKEANTSEFADDCLSWESKWLMAKDQFTNAGEHAAFIRNAFSRHVLNGDKLERLIAQGVAAYGNELDSIDGALLVRLQFDASNFPGGKIPSLHPDALHAEQSLVVDEAVEASKADVLPAAMREIVSWVVSDAITSVVLQVGESIGILTKEQATTGWMPVGTNVAVGLAVNGAMKDVSNPVGELQASLDRRLQQLRNRILEGDAKSPGVLPRMREHALARETARRQAIDAFLSGASVR